MRIPARLGLAVSFAAIAITAACSDSSGPSNADTAAEVASHFDSIYVDAFARSDSGNNAYAVRVELATLLEVNAALGAVPATINVTTASGTEHWKGYEFVELTPPGANVDSEFVLLAYRESAAHTVLAIFFDSTGAAQMGGLITNDTLSINPTAAQGSTTLTSVGTTCSAPSASLLNPQFNSQFFATCTLATFQTNMTLTFPATTGVDAALTTVSFPVTTINGIRIVDETESTRRVQGLLHALHANMKRL